MKFFKLSRTCQVGIAFISTAALSILLTVSSSPVMAEMPAKLGHDDTEFVFMGKCENGDIYRLFAYEKIVDGLSHAYYDYEGPAGKGTVRSRATPRTMSVRVCRQLAEIIDDH